MKLEDFGRQELQYLDRCLELATEALRTGNQPFGSLLAGADGQLLAEDYNRVASGDPTRHPEFELARWAATNMPIDERATATMYTTGEHCPMCAAAHGWVGLGRIVYISASAQLAEWLAEWGVAPAPVRTLRIQDVLRDAVVVGPIPELVGQVRELHWRYYRKGGQGAG